MKREFELKGIKAIRFIGELMLFNKESIKNFKWTRADGKENVVNEFAMNLLRLNNSLDNVVFKIEFEPACEVLERIKTDSDVEWLVNVYGPGMDKSLFENQ